MPKIADAAERARALDISRSFIVQAPAGSGKTELLTQRVLALLAVADRPEAIAAMTFTIKAAAEMRSRILEALQRARMGEAPEKPHQRTTWELARAALARDALLGWDLARNPGRLHVHTIDSFCAWLTRRLPLTAGFGAQPAIVEDATALYTEAARRTLEILESGGACADAVAVLVARLDARLDNAERLLTEMLPKREQWLRYIGAGAARDQNTVRAQLEDNLSRSLCAQLSAVRARVAPLLERGGTTVPGCSEEDIAAWRWLAECLLTQKGEWRKNSGYGDADPELAKQLASVRKLPDPRYSDDQWAGLRALFEVLPTAVANLKLVFRERRAVDFVELAHGALAALGPAEAPTEIAYALDGRIEHILVDEFQDTSVVQYELVEALVREWQPGDGRTLFCVGDPMQSIYGFRDADVGRYLETAQARRIGPVPLEKLTLKVNFRSNAGVVSWNNAAFAAAFPADAEPDAGAVPYVTSVPASNGSPKRPVEVHPFIGIDRDTEADLVGNLISGAHGRGTVAVLVRARTHAAVIAARLRERGIACQAVEMDSLADSVSVRDLLALTRALLHPADRVSWLAVLRAPWCGLTLADLTTLCEGRPDATVLELLRGRHGMSEDAAIRVARVLPFLEDAVANRMRVPLRTWVESVWLRLGGPATLRGASEIADAHAYLDVLSTFDTAIGNQNLSGLAVRLEQLFSQPDANAPATVQLLTMHKAKGLEFDTVIIPGLGRPAPGDSEPLLHWHTHQGRVLLAPVHETGDDDNPLSAWFRGLAAQRRDLEMTRLLYVAATRAREKLHLIGHTDLSSKGNLCKPHGGSMLRRLWPVVEPAFEEAFHQPTLRPAAAERVPPLRVIRRFDLDWSLPAPPPAPLSPMLASPAGDDDRITFEWVGDTLRHVGTVVHGQLQRVAGGGSDAASGPPLWESELRALGVPAADVAFAVGRVKRAVGNTLADERGRWVLAPHTSGVCELALTAAVDGRVRRLKIDRTFIDEYGTRWVVDYKTSSHEGSGVEAFLDEELRRYEEQLRRYAAALTALDPEHPVRAGLYFPLLQAWRECTLRAGAASVSNTSLD